MGIKNEPDSNLNLNRQFYFDTPLKKFFKVMKKIIKGSTFCIDIHDMPGSQLPLSSIITLTGNSEVEDLSLNLLKRFGPIIYWKEDFSNPKTTQRFNGTINSYLNSVGIPNFSIETSSIEKISANEIKKVVSGLIKLTTKSAVKKSLFIKRVEIFSPNNGIIIPADIKLMSSINKNQPLGELFSSTFKKFSIVSPTNGLLIRKTVPRYVFKGQKLFDVGIII
jgi:predicted deacylase